MVVGHRRWRAVFESELLARRSAAMPEEWEHNYALPLPKLRRNGFTGKRSRRSFKGLNTSEGPNRAQRREASRLFKGVTRALRVSAAAIREHNRQAAQRRGAK